MMVKKMVKYLDKFANIWVKNVKRFRAVIKNIAEWSTGNMSS